VLAHGYPTIIEIASRCCSFEEELIAMDMEAAQEGAQAGAVSKSNRWERAPVKADLNASKDDIGK
jgi:hypothetical protein